MKKKTYPDKECGSRTCQKIYTPLHHHSNYCSAECNKRESLNRNRDREARRKKEDATYMAELGNIICTHRSCSNTFLPHNHLQRYCGPDCAAQEKYQRAVDKRNAIKLGLIEPPIVNVDTYKPVNPYFLRRGPTFDVSNIGTGCSQIAGDS